MSEDRINYCATCDALDCIHVAKNNEWFLSKRVDTVEVPRSLLLEAWAACQCYANSLKSIVKNDPGQPDAYGFELMEEAKETEELGERLKALARTDAGV